MRPIAQGCRSNLHVCGPCLLAPSPRILAGPPACSAPASLITHPPTCQPGSSPPSAKGLPPQITPLYAVDIQPTRHVALSPPPTLLAQDVLRWAASLCVSHACGCDSAACLLPRSRAPHLCHAKKPQPRLPPAPSHASCIRPAGRLSLCLILLAGPIVPAHTEQGPHSMLALHVTPPPRRPPMAAPCHPIRPCAQAQSAHSPVEGWRASSSAVLSFSGRDGQLLHAKRQRPRQALQRWPLSQMGAVAWRARGSCS